MKSITAWQCRAGGGRSVTRGSSRDRQLCCGGRRLRSCFFTEESGLCPAEVFLPTAAIPDVSLRAWHWWKEPPAPLPGLPGKQPPLRSSRSPSRDLQPWGQPGHLVFSLLPVRWERRQEAVLPGGTEQPLLSPGGPAPGPGRLLGCFAVAPCRIWLWRNPLALCWLSAPSPTKQNPELTLGPPPAPCLQPRLAANPLRWRLASTRAFTGGYGDCSSLNYLTRAGCASRRVGRRDFIESVWLVENKSTCCFSLLVLAGHCRPVAAQLSQNRSAGSEREPRQGSVLHSAEPEIQSSWITKARRRLKEERGEPESQGQEPG